MRNSLSEVGSALVPVIVIFVSEDAMWFISSAVRIFFERSPAWMGAFPSKGRFPVKSITTKRAPALSASANLCKASVGNVSSSEMAKSENPPWL